ncbi:hypothetical protein Zm00014a_025949 [Zea mays]|uniref:Uncharacterized protein n=1 Tax=Zea mays TaxID=4577 RepID=A0A3L6G9S5_MAIZE|nr:hypothetical protein Zm00014a_025949 [Zea mays]
MEERGTAAMESDGRGEATVKNRPWTTRWWPARKTTRVATRGASKSTLPRLMEAKKPASVQKQNTVPRHVTELSREIQPGAGTRNGSSAARTQEPSSKMSSKDGRDSSDSHGE